MRISGECLHKAKPTNVFGIITTTVYNWSNSFGLDMPMMTGQDPLLRGEFFRGPLKKDSSKERTLTR